MISELDTVVLEHDIQEYSLTKGDIGAVVYCYEKGQAFEVEFITAGGETIALLTLSSNDVRLMYPKEILHVRELTAA